jgi:hypothetical protein
MGSQIEKRRKGSYRKNGEDSIVEKRKCCLKKSGEYTMRTRSICWCEESILVSEDSLGTQKTGTQNTIND